MAFTSCGNVRKAKYMKQVQDIEVIPDKHNCGCHGTLSPFYEVWTRFSDTTAGQIYVSDSDLHTVENCEFSNVSLYFHYKTYTSNFVFRNCLFDGNYNSKCKFNVQISGVESYMDIYFYNCTFERSYNAVNSITNRRVRLHFINCKSILPRGDHFKVAKEYELKNCYTIGGANIDSAHSDGYQFSEGDGFVVENYRSEMIPLNTASIKQVCNCCAYTDFQEGTVLTTDFIYLRNAMLNGAGTTLAFGSSNGHTLDNVHVHNSVSGCAYQYHKDSIPARFAETVDNVAATKAFISSVWKENGQIHFLASNYTNEQRTIIAVDASDNQTTFTIDACPVYSEYHNAPETYVTQDDFPFDVEYTLTDSDYVVFYDTSVSEANQIRFADTF